MRSGCPPGIFTACGIPEERKIQDKISSLLSLFLVDITCPACSTSYILKILSHQDCAVEGGYCQALSSQLCAIMMMFNQYVDMSHLSVAGINLGQKEKC